MVTCFEGVIGSVSLMDTQCDTATRVCAEWSPSALDFFGVMMDVIRPRKLR